MSVNISPPSRSGGADHSEDPPATAQNLLCGDKINEFGASFGAPDATLGVVSQHDRSSHSNYSGHSQRRSSLTSVGGSAGAGIALSVGSTERRAQYHRAQEAQVQKAMSAQDERLELQLAHYTSSNAKKSSTRNISSSMLHSSVQDSNNVDESNKQQEATSSGVRFAAVYQHLLSPIKCSGRTYAAVHRIIFLLAIVSAFLTPYRLAFDRDQVQLKATELAIDIIFCLWMLLHAVHVLPANYRHSRSHHYEQQQQQRAFQLQLQQQQDISETSRNIRYHIFLNYVLSKRCLLDLLTALPLDIIVQSAMLDTTGDENNKLLFCLGMFRLGRLYAVYEFFSKAEVNVRYSYVFTRLSKFLLMSLLQAHWFGCIFYFVAINERIFQSTWLALVQDVKPDGLPRSPGYLYLTALYWAVATVSTVGYGDITPQNVSEYAVIIVLLISNTFLAAFIIGNVTNVVTTGEESTRMFRTRYRHLEKYMAINLLPEDVKETMRAHMMLQFNVAKEHREALDEFPAVFRSRIQRLLYRPILEVSFLGDIASEAFIDTLACTLRVEMFMPETDAVSQADAAFEMFFVVSGVAEVLLEDEAYMMEEVENELDAEEAEVERQEQQQEATEAAAAAIPTDSGRKERLGSPFKRNFCRSFDDTQHGQISAYDRNKSALDPKQRSAQAVARKYISVASVGKGECFGELSFLFNLLQPFTVRTTSMCRMLSLKREAWEMVRSSYPGDIAAVQQSVAESLTYHLNAAEDPRLREVYADYEGRVASKLMQQQQDKVAELCQAASANNVYALRQALAGGFDVNIGDYDMRTALHIAAAKGAVSSISFLLERGANPNIIDEFGITPLFEAVKNGKEAAAELLFAAGGSLGVQKRIDDAQEQQQEYNQDRPSSPQYRERYTGNASTTSLASIAEQKDEKDDVDSSVVSELNHLVSKKRNSSALGITIGSKQQDEGSFLCQIAAQGDVAYLKRLLRYGLSASSADYDGRTAMHLAASCGYLQILEALLESISSNIDSGAVKWSPKLANHLQRSIPSPSILNALDNFGRTPLLEAVRSQQEPCARLLHSHGAELGFLVITAAAPQAGQPVLDRSRLHAGAEMCQAAYEKNDDYLRLLLKFGCPVNAADYDLRTAAHIACAENFLSTVLLLVEYKADFAACLDRWGRSPLQEAELQGHVKLLHVLRALPTPQEITEHAFRSRETIEQQHQLLQSQES